MSNPQTTQNQTYHAILEALNHLINVVAKLRSPDGGCPWDLAQTPQTLIPYIIEEAYEVVHALRSEDQKAIVEELGDLLLQVVLQAQIAKDYGHFSLQEVAEGITEKLIRRHPHVFSDVTVENSEEVRQNWERIKAEEKGETQEMAQLLSRKLDRYHRTLPPLMASSKISVKAAKAGFEWENVEGVWDKFSEELTEFKESLETDDKSHQQAELGDLLFTIINLARWYDLDASEALSGTNERFIQRLSKMEKFADRPLNDYALEDLEKLWQQAKKQLNQ
ncbi:MULTISPECIES: nucleoside triphosphate pyrophosphohydrolase [Crocosphaera]|uniref:Nucleoside triphosphate pyrophosphohydrolase MazG n=4 Tax=Crocosphaera watsonii TaxID=263511 RepID=T2JYH2_CROWT|nr:MULTISPECIES: nucleoside triphosphate pyrophosphohydrolase [Crocosphaera]EHJ12904.1 Nucleoside triphosphate pyrophosphohydrolase MazG [Crocosphaera watsonii WH 0003]MCH2245706.1 nucleoside triphosphate pyrophosphohydrolase [Crocosphaera sp.]NQZ62029.1 nucleoside triphosphate pyrophosphohydrolase [Crocosphaera sp.]CCQ54615.1 Nucleoside triphosphate pyrophosphohydrolase MazG [Crocosphaera watsonii WH 0005]CCQ63821.1 Nucleoside triphosphate pyrophosphohydrolase MazG [Crocosphaera watsonii WH 0